MTASTSNRRARALLVGAIALVLVTAGTATASTLTRGTTSVRGRVTVAVSMSRNGSMESHVSLTDAKGREYAISSGEVANALQAHSGDEVALTGKVAGATVTPDTFHYVPSWDQPHTGPKRALVMRFTPGSTSPPSSSGDKGWRDLMFDGANSLSKMWAHESHGKITLTGDVVDEVLPAGSGTNCQSAGGWTSSLAAKHPGYDFYLGADSQLCGNVAGTAIVGGNFSWYYGAVTERELWHEMGHNLGFGHGNTLSCVANRVAVSISDNCSTTEYGDNYSPMGGGSGACAYNAYDQLIAQWDLPYTQVTASGTYALRARNLDDNGKPRALIISGAPSDWGGFYILEWRTADYSSCTSRSNKGLQLRVVENAREGAKTNLLTAHPGLDPLFGVNETFTDPMSGITVTMLSQDVTAGIAQVKITMNSSPPPGPTTTTSTSTTTTTTIKPPTGGTRTVSVVGGQLRITDGTGTSDHISVSGNTSSMIVTDSRDLAPGAGCTPVSARKVKCVNATSLAIDAGGGNDLVQVSAKIPGSVRGGDGNDQIRTRNSTAGTVDCDSGNDIVTVDKNMDTLTGCERVRYS